MQINLEWVVVEIVCPKRAHAFDLFAQNATVLFWIQGWVKCVYMYFEAVQAPVVQRLDNAIHRINHYPVDKRSQNKPRYPLDSDLSGG